MSKKSEQKDIRDLVKREQKKIEEELRTKNANMFKTATKPEEVQVYLTGVPNLSSDPKSLATVKVNDVNLVKAVCTQSHAIPNMTVIDLKLNTNGPFEDEIYSSFPFIIKNIRRGNTVLRVDSSNSN